MDSAHRNILFHQDGKTATISVIERTTGERSLLTNGKPDGMTHPRRKTVTTDDNTMVLLGALGPIHHPKAKRAAVIGLGTGTSSAVLLEAPGIESLDTIEIEPLVVEAAQYFRPANARAFDDPRSRIVIVRRGTAELVLAVGPNGVTRLELPGTAGSVGSAAP